MIFCPNCNQKLKDGTQFCSGCGTKIPEPVQPDVVPNTAEPTNQKKKVSKKFFLFGGIGIAVIAVIVLVVVLLSGGTSENNAALYIKDGQLYFANMSGDSVKPWEISQNLFEYDSIDNEYLAERAHRLANYTQLSKDGSIIFYPDRIGDSMTLYYRSTKSAKAQAVKIDTDVTSYFVNDAASMVIYSKGSSDTLYQYILKTDSKEKIANDVEDYYVTSDGKKIGYINEDNNVYLFNGKDKEKLASDVDSILMISEDASSFYYKKNNAVYLVPLGKDAKKIVSNVDDVITIYDDGTMYYTKENETEISLWDYVDDDMAVADAAMKEPVEPTYPEYPYRSDFDTSEEYYAARDAYYDARDQYYEDYEEYENELRRYQAKEERDDLRRELKNSTMTHTGNTLYFFDGKKEHVITDTYADYRDYALEAAVILYRAYEEQEIDKVQLSDISYASSVRYQIAEALSSGSTHYVAAGKKSAEINMKDIETYDISNDGSIIYLTTDVDEDENVGDLYKISISKDKIKSPELYDSDVYIYSNLFTTGTDFIYFKDVEQSAGTLYLNKKKVDNDVYYGSMAFPENGNLYYLTDYDLNKHYGTLNMYANGKVTKIEDDVTQYIVMPNGKVLYLYDYSYKYYSGDLYVWSKGRAKKIDTDVVSLMYLNQIQYKD